METISQAVDNKDYKILKLEAHAIKSSSSLLGARKLCAIAEDIEQACIEQYHDKALQLSSLLLETGKATLEKLYESN